MTEVLDAAGPALRDPERFAANLEALKDWAPNLRAQLLGLGRTHSELLVDPEGGIDIAFLGQRFYRVDAKSFAEAQVAEFFKAPIRNALNEPDPENLKGGIGEFCKRLTARLAEAGIGYDPAQTREDSHFLIVLGVGLGLHLPELLARSQCRCLILIEPTLENLHHSMQVLDWQDLLAKARARGVEITFVTERDPTAIALQVLAAVRADNPVLCDGLYLYTHYPSVLLQQAARQIQSEVYSTLRGLGFFEDEEIMTRNTIGNIASPVVRLVDQLQSPREAPLFIVGSGPSLEAELAFLKSNAGRVAILSLGTALRILLEQGIRPDFHIELENTANTAKSVEATAAEFDTSGITLVAAVSVDPRVAACFERVAFFLREENSGTVLMGQPVMTLSPSGPTVANAGLMVGLRFGFREIYLFGVDMGSREAGQHHAAGTIFSKGILPEHRRSDRNFAGNFGGEAWGEAVLNWSRQYLEVVLRRFTGMSVYNCSDGVRIAGAIPKVSRAIQLPDHALDRAVLLQEVEAGLAHLKGERLAAACRSGIAAARQEALIPRLLEVFEAAQAAAAQPETEWVHEAAALLRSEAEGRSLIGAYIQGSLLLILGCALWYDRRLVEPQQRDAYRRLALAEILVSLRDFEGRLERLFSEAESTLSGVEEAPAEAVG